MHARAPVLPLPRGNCFLTKVIEEVVFARYTPFALGRAVEVLAASAP